VGKKTAITVYVDNNKYGVEEFSWLYKSWIYSGCRETSDILLFCNPEVYDDLPEDAGIKKYRVEPLSDRDVVWSDYRFINSVEYLTTDIAKAAVSGYEYILRTDGDVFLTKNFSGLESRLTLFGTGCFVQTKDVADRIFSISQKLGLCFSHMYNTGSTLFSKTASVITYSKVQFDVCKYLLDNEFSEAGAWPGWYRGTLTMYAGDIAANAIFGLGFARVGIDCMSMSNEKISSTDYHIHAFHTNQYFSKLHLRAGDYDGFNLVSLDTSIVNNYCLFIAKSSVDSLIQHKKPCF